METNTQTGDGSVRERILAAAYDLFSNQGLGATGVDAIIARAGVAKASFYKYFPSKNDLIQAFLAMREERWTVQWFQNEVKRRATSPRERLLTIFDVFHEWFQQPNLEGCSFINVLLETQRNEPTHHAAAQYLCNIRTFVRSLAAQAGLADIDDFAYAWHTLMKGSIITAQEGYLDSARVAHRAAAILLDGWPEHTADISKIPICEGTAPQHTL